jgi:putative heme iron utilization protein
MTSRAIKEREVSPAIPNAITNATAQRADPVLSELIEWGS